MRINVTIPEDLLKEIDSYCADNKYDRSEFLRKLVREAFDYEETMPLKKVYEVTEEKELENKKDFINRYGGKISKPVEKSVPIVSKKLTPPSSGWCNLHVAHEFVSGKKYEVRLITWEDENGNKIVEEKFACNSCVAYYQKLDRGTLTFL